MKNPIARDALRVAGGVSGALRLFLLIALLGLLAGSVENFLSIRNGYALLQSFALLGLVTLGLALTMLVGQFDLSVGSMVAVGGLITIKVGGSDHLMWGIAAALAFAVLVGSINALLFSRLKLSSLVITVGTMIALSGFAYWLAAGKVISTENFDLGEVLDDPIAGLLSVRSIITFTAFAMAAGLISFTRLGRDIIATGSRLAAAEVCGVSTTAVYLFVFVTSSACAALAGGLLSISLATASATMGSNILLQAASAAIIGGVALSGGIGSFGGVLVGVLLLTTVNNGLSLIGANTASILLINGAVLFTVVVFDGRAGQKLKEVWASRATA
jgi:ribose/xylose/arabinose/galactoside ABC-type transport system permease subunit